MHKNKAFANFLDNTLILLGGLSIPVVIYITWSIGTNWILSAASVDASYGFSFVASQWYLGAQIVLLFAFSALIIVSAIRHYYWVFLLYIPAAIFLIPSKMTIFYGPPIWLAIPSNLAFPLELTNTWFIAIGLLGLAFWLLFPTETTQTFPSKRDHTFYNLKRFYRRLLNITGMLCTLTLIFGVWGTLKNWHVGVDLAHIVPHSNHGYALWNLITTVVLNNIILAVIAFACFRKSLGVVIIIAAYSIFNLPQAISDYGSSFVQWPGWFLVPDRLYYIVLGPFMICGLIALAMRIYFKACDQHSDDSLLQRLVNERR